ncbi:hypothetical protein HN51_055511, partial [Arachis hypogaea]
MELLSPILFTSGCHSSVVQRSLQSDYGGDETWKNKSFLMKLSQIIIILLLHFNNLHLTHKNISQNHKFQTIGLGWAFTDSVLHRLVPLWGLEANTNL